jgi:hypothetical protein
MWQRRTVCRSWWTTKRAQISREKPSTMENSQIMRVTPGSSVNATSKRARSTWACPPGGVSKRTSKGVMGSGRMPRTARFTAV